MTRDDDGTLTQLVRTRAIQLARYLKEFVQLRQPVRRDLDSYRKEGFVLWLADVPTAPGCWSAANAAQKDEDTWLHVAKQHLPDQPTLPEKLRPWVDPGARTTDLPTLRQFAMLPVRGGGPDGPTERSELTSHPEVVAAWQTFNRTFEEWRAEYLKKKAIQDVYSTLFRIHQQQQRLGEVYELVVGLGLLSWKTKNGEQVFRHVCTSQAELVFDSTNGVLSIRCPGVGAQLSLEDDMLEPTERPQPDQRTIAQDLLRVVGDAIWDRGLFGPFFRSWGHAIHPDTRYAEDVAPPPREKTEPHLHFAPALILRRRPARGVVETYSRIAEQLADGAEIPFGFARLVHTFEAEPSERSGDGPMDGEPPGIGDIHFPLLANEEQRQIVRRLTAHRGVLVQGPPGTGKSQTIANLLCHLLAEGKRVLITSETPRALRVLKEKVPEELRPLCVSLLDTDTTSQAELAASVNGITQRHSDWNRDQQSQLIRGIQGDLLEKRKQLAEIDRKLREFREAEIFEVSLAEGVYKGTAQRIARQLSEERPSYEWASSLVDVQGPPTISNDEALRLLDLLRSVSPSRAQEVELRLPDLDKLLLPGDLATLIDQEGHAAAELEGFTDVRVTSLLQQVQRLSSTTRAELRGRLAAALRCRLELDERGHPWLEQALDEAVAGRGQRWEVIHARLVESLDGLCEGARIVDTTVLIFPEGRRRDDVLADAEIMLSHLESGGTWKRLGFVTSIARTRIYLRTEVRINGRAAEEPDALRQLVGVLQAERKLEQLWGLWAGILAPESGPREVQARRLEDLRASLDGVFALSVELREMKALIGTASGVSQNHLTALLRALDAAESSDRLAQSTARFAQVRELLLRTASMHDGHPCSQRLLRALEGRDARAWSLAFGELERLVTDFRRLRVRTEIESRLRAAAPCLASALVASSDSREWDGRLSHLVDAWNWTRASRWLADREDVNEYERLDRRRSELETAVTRGVSHLASALAWQHALGRLTRGQTEALQGWKLAQSLIGKGKGKNVEKYRAQARKYMDACAGGIPAWIMPRYKVAEAVGAQPERFDVLIVDEASQSGIDGLFLFYLAKRVVVVGDDQQITPQVVGVEVEAVNALQAQFLPGDLPHRGALGTEVSIYDHASVRFGEAVVLREHFRCMPEIIRFSNEVCYAPRGTPLIPLRQYPLDRIEPVLARMVPTGFREGESGNVRNVPEAEALVDQVVSCARDRRYYGKTFGVVSLQGEAQAQLIEKLLIERLGPEVVERRKLTCGDAYAFQGDERDVMFLSLVAASNARAAPLTALPYVRRFNVAASRARDQMWLFHSIKAEELHPECMRRRLLEHCLDPTRAEKAVAELEFDSDFERDVYDLIVPRGYKIRSQVPAGDQSRSPFRIDLVVEGEKSRLAIECDGDRWHGADRYELDMARERALRRAGWTFFRIRASTFYLAPSRSLLPLWAMLDSMGIHPANRRVIPASDEVTRPPEDEPVRSAFDVRMDNAALSPEELGRSVPAAGSSAPDGAALGRIARHGVEEPAVPVEGSSDRGPLEVEGTAIVADPLQGTPAAADVERLTIRKPFNPSIPPEPSVASEVTTNASPTASPDVDRAAQRLRDALVSIRTVIRANPTSPLGEAIGALMNAVVAADAPPWDRAQYLITKRRKIAEEYALEASIREYEEALRGRPRQGSSAATAGVSAPEPYVAGGGHQELKLPHASHPLLPALEPLLPQSAWPCPTCKGARRMWVGSRGPFLKCSNGCENQPVVVALVSSALASLGVTCPQCGAGTVARRGPHGTFIGCTKYPACHGSIIWKNLRSHLGTPGNGDQA